jgi:hypothetical protein
MMAKSEIALLAITVLGTLAAGLLAGQHPSFMRPIYGQPSIACSVPVSAFQAAGPSFGEEKALFDQVSRISHALP